MNDHASFDRRHLAVIALLATLVFANTLSVPFQWDGLEFIADNPIIHDLDNFIHPSEAVGEKWYGAFKSRFVGYLSFAVNYALHGVKPLGYHLFNIAVHVLNSLLVYFLVLFLLRTPALSDSELAQRAGSVGMWAALIFAAHPVQSEAVTYIFQRHASLVALFYLGSLVSWLCWRLKEVSADASRARWWWYALSLVLALLAMKTKENAFTLPVMVVIVEFLFFSRDMPKGKRLLLLLPFIALMAIVPLTLVGIDRPVGEIMSGLGQRAGQYAALDGGGREYLLTQARVVVTYLRLFLFPINQNLDYDYPSPLEVGQAAFALAMLVHLALWTGAVLMVVIGRGGLRGLREQSEQSGLRGLSDLREQSGRGELLVIGFGLIWFYLALSVESSVIAIPMAIAEYRMYLPLAGLAAGASVLLHMALSGKAREFVLVLLVLMLGVLAVERNALWRDSVTLWEDAASKSPMKARPWYNLGVFKEAGGDHTDMERAVELYRRSVALDPGYVDAHYNLGLALERLGQYEGSVLSYERVLALDPARGDALNNLGVVYERLGKMGKAAAAYMRSIQVSPLNVEPRLNLGSVLLRDGRYREASAVLREALALGGATVSAYQDLGMSYFRLGLLEDAESAYREAVALDPLSPEALYNLATVSLKRGQYEQAASQFRNAFAIRAGYADAHMGLAASLERMGRMDEAQEEFGRAVALAPDNPVAHFRLGTFLDLRGKKALAVESYLRAIELDPASANAMNNLGTIYSERGDALLARKYFQLAVGADPAHADAHNNLGVVLYDLRQHRDAFGEFTRAVALAPGNENFRSNLAAIKRVLGIKD